MERKEIKITPKKLEARTWLKRTRIPHSLANNRFGGMDYGGVQEGALRFVDELYEMGALKVRVVERETSEGPRERYADTLEVNLPKDPIVRRNIIDLANVEKERGSDPIKEEGQKIVTFWWD